MTEVYNKIIINGEQYYSVESFAIIVGRSEQAIRLAIRLGNRFRKLRAIHVGRQLYINCSELTEYLFAHSGRSKMVDSFDEFGNKTTRYYA